MTLVFDPLGDRAKLGTTAAVLLTFTGNLPIPGVSAAAFHGWTLATEEQFYLLWPAILAFAWVRGRVGAALITVGIAALAACTATLVWLWPHADNAYALPTSWFVCFVIGAAVRLRGKSIARWAVPVAGVVLAVLSVVPLRGHALTYLVAGTGDRGLHGRAAARLVQVGAGVAAGAAVGGARHRVLRRLPVELPADVVAAARNWVPPPGRSRRCSRSWRRR